MEDFQKTATNQTGDSSSKLCMEVIQEHWVKRTGGTSIQFEAAVRKQLNAPDASREELNKLYENAVRAREIKNRGSAGEEIFDKAVKAWHCE